MNEDAAVELGGAPVEDLGLVWDQENRRLYDPETGEVVTLDLVNGEGSAKAAAFRIWGTEASIAVLKSQKKAIEKQIKQREKRLEAFKALYLEGMVEVAKGMMERSKTKLQSIPLGYSVVGWQTTRRSVKVLDHHQSLCFAAARAPESMKATIDFELLSEERRKSFAAMLVNLSEVEENGVDIDVRTSKIPEALIGELDWHNGFAVEPGGEQGWYVKGAKPKAEKIGGEEE